MKPCSSSLAISTLVRRWALRETRLITVEGTLALGHSNKTRATSSSGNSMKKHVAPSAQVNKEDSSADIPQAPKVRPDPSTAGAPLPARTKRKFAAPAAVATTSNWSATAGIAKQPYTSVSADKGNPPLEQSGASAQYFSVLYTKRVANKVSLTVVFGL